MSTTSYEGVLHEALQLTSEEQRRLAQELVLRSQTVMKPRRSLRGVLADLGPAPSGEEIDEMRREAWANFPRDEN